MIEKKTILLIFITPHIIRSADDLEEMTNKSRQAMERVRQQDINFDQPIDKIESDLNGKQPDNDVPTDAAEGN